MATTFTVKSETLPQLRPEIARIQTSFNVIIDIQEKTQDELLSWIRINGKRQKEAKDYITTFCNPECTQLLVCPAHFAEYLEDTRRRLEVNYKVVCRLFDDLSMEVCGSTLDVTLAASAFEEIINQFDDSVADERNNKNHDEIIDSHLCSFAQNDEWQGLETSINLPAHVKRALLSVLSEEKEEVSDQAGPVSPDEKCVGLGEVGDSLDSTDEDDHGFNTSVVCSTVKKKPRPTPSGRIAARFPGLHSSLDGSYIEDQESVIFMGMKTAPNHLLDESIIGGNVTMSPKTKKMRLDTIDTIVIDNEGSQQTLIEVLMEVGYEQWAIEAAQATLSEEDRTNHTKILAILQSQKNEIKLKSLTLPSDMRKIKQEHVSGLVTPSLPKSQDLSFMSLHELEKKHQQLINSVNNRQPKSMFTPMRVKQESFGSPSLPQSTPLVKFNTSAASTISALDETVVDAGSRKNADEQSAASLRSLNEDVEYIGQLNVGVKTKKEPEDWIYVSSSSSGESSTEAVQKIKVTSEKSFVSAIETELAARQESNLLTQKAELEEEMKKQQDDIMKELKKRYDEQTRQMRLENERLQKQQEASIKELRQMMEKQNKEQLKKDEQLKMEMNQKDKKDNEIKELEEQTKKMQKALKQQEETMKQLQRQQQTLANAKTQLPIESPIRIEPKATGLSGGLRPIVIDGSNVAMTHGKKKVFSCRGIALCVKYFQDRGHKEITVFLPHWRKTQEAARDRPIKDKPILDDLERKEILHFTPSRKVKGRFITSYDDRFIIRLASMNDGVIVSNDNYRDLMGESEKWKRVIEERLLMYNIVGDIFLVPDDPLGRNGPTLNDFLTKQPLNSNEPATVPTSDVLLQQLSAYSIQQLAVPPQIAPPVRWNQQTHGQHFPELGAPAGQPNRHQRYAPHGTDRRQNIGQSMQRPVHARTEPIRHFRPPDTHRQRPQHRDHKQDVDRRKQEQPHHQQNEQLAVNNDMEELTRVFEKLVTIFPNQEEKIMTVLHRYPDVKDVNKYENMIRNVDMPEKVPQDVRTLPMYTQLKNVFPDSDTAIVKLLTKYPQVDDMNALCAMLLE